MSAIFRNNQGSVSISPIHLSSTLNWSWTDPHHIGRRRGLKWLRNSFAALLRYFPHQPSKNRSRSPPSIAAGTLPALELFSGAVETELDVQDKRGDAIDTKSGLVLGLAGVLASIQLHRIASAQYAGEKRAMGLRPKPDNGRDRTDYPSCQGSWRVRNPL